MRASIDIFGQDTDKKFLYSLRNYGRKFSLLPGLYNCDTSPRVALAVLFSRLY